jgi:hypothetical protein
MQIPEPSIDLAYYGSGGTPDAKKYGRIEAYSFGIGCN